MTREETLAAEDIAAKLASVVPDGAHAEVRLYGAEGKRIARVKIDRRPPGRGEPVVEVGDDVEAKTDGKGGCFDECNAGTCPAEKCPGEKATARGMAEDKITDKAGKFLRAGREILTARGREYDRPDGERSAIAAAKMWSALTGREMKESEAWEFLACVKLVRLQTAPGPHDDSATDAAVYSALAGEARHREQRAKDAAANKSAMDERSDGVTPDIEKLMFGVNAAWSPGRVPTADEVVVKSTHTDTSGVMFTGPIAPARLVGMLRELSSAVSAFFTKIERLEAGPTQNVKPSEWDDFKVIRQMLKSAQEACRKWSDGKGHGYGVTVTGIDPAGDRQRAADAKFLFRVHQGGSSFPDWSNPLIGSTVSAAEWEKLTGNLAPAGNSTSGNGWREGLWWTYTTRENRPPITSRSKCGDDRINRRGGGALVNGFFVNGWPVTREAYERLTGSPIMPGVTWAEFEGWTAYEADPKKLVDDLTGPKDTLRGLGSEFLVKMLGDRMETIPVDSRKKVVNMMKDIIDADRKRHEQAPRTEGAGA